MLDPIYVPSDDPRFPEGLRSIADPPKGLWVLGNVEALSSSARLVGVVGARSCSDYGAHMARRISRELVENGFGVVSGLARGIDGHAHRAALAHNGGVTIAVLGCGIDRAYPNAHAELYSDIIAKGGAIVSEYEPGVAPAPWRFPARNRIIAGLSEAVIVVEARERSGALITVDYAMEQGKPVLAVPGEITSEVSAGSNGLLRHDGVTAYLDMSDLLSVVEAPSHA